MPDLGDISAHSKNLEKQRDALLKDLENLKERLKNGEISEDEYQEERRKIERKIVEVMDRLAQMRFLMGRA
jgi:regulator of replication initiation timing